MAARSRCQRFYLVYVTATTDPLLRSLLESGLARPDPFRLGIEADAGGALLNAPGAPGDRIFTLGPTLRGQLYETTAIPEIRDQAAVLAGRLLAVCRARAASLAAPGQVRHGGKRRLGRNDDGNAR